MATLRATLVAAAFLSVFAAPVLADPAEGRYTTRGNHSQYGSITGDVTIGAPVDGVMPITGTHRTSSGRTIAFTGEARRSGQTLQLKMNYKRLGIVGVIGGQQTVTARGTYAGSGQQLRGTYATRSATNRITITETLTRAGVTPPTPNTGVAIDLVLVAPSGVMSEADEEAKGLVLVHNLDDDDNDGGAAGDGMVRVVGDAQDPNATSGEDDLLELRIKKPATAPAGTTMRLVFGAKVAVWRNADRTGRVASGESLPLADCTLRIEGVEATAPGAGDAISVEAVSNGQVVGRDAARVHVTRSAFLLEGHGCTGTWGLSSDIQARAYDRRREPAVIQGKDASGATCYWSVWAFESEKGAKIALSTPGSVVAYDGHSNFGLGFAFKTGFSRLHQFLNIADAQIPVNWEYMREHQDHPSLDFTDSEYGDDMATSAPFDPVQGSATVEGSQGPLRKPRYLLSGGVGARLGLTRGGSKRWLDHHYGEDGNYRIVVKAGSRDMPEKRWSKLFLNSCYSGSYYYDSFGGHGSLFFTRDESSATRTSSAFIFAAIDGKTDAQILETINAIENINDFHAFGGQ